MDKKVKQNVDEIIVFTDGSCIRKSYNGKQYIIAGYGIYYPNGELPDTSRALKNYPPTNNRAELQAIYIAIIQVKNNFNFNKLTIYTDSKYCISSLTDYIIKWRQNGWLTGKKQPVENQDIIKPIDDIMSRLKNKVHFIHVKAHTKKQDKISLSNEYADKLANNGSEKAKPYWST